MRCALLCESSSNPASGSPFHAVLLSVVVMFQEVDIFGSAPGCNADSFNIVVYLAGPESAGPELGQSDIEDEEQHVPLRQ